jgi:hypothetical protein
LLGDAGEKAIKSMNSMPKILTAGANWRGWISTMSWMKDFRSG